MATTSFTAAIAAAAFFMLSGCATTHSNPGVVPPDARFDGKTYSEWAGASWKWALELPVARSASPAHATRPDCGSM